MDMTQVERWQKYVAIRDNEIKKYKELISTIDNLLTVPASNRKFMQIANPARQIKNLIKSFSS